MPWHVCNVRSADARGSIYAGRGPKGSHMLNTPIGKRGWLGNPFQMTETVRGKQVWSTPEACVASFEIAFLQHCDLNLDFKAAFLALRGDCFSCFCVNKKRLPERPFSCHAEVLAWHLNEWEDLCIPII